MDSAISSSASPSAARNGSLPGAIDATRRDLETQHGGRIHYYVDTAASGRPIVLIHSINAAPSAHEMKPLFEQFRAKRPVYALDLPGFGHSDRGKRRYSPALFTSVITEFLETVVEEPADLVAYSLGCELSGLAAASRPELVRSLVMLSPTGFNARGLPTGEAAERAYRFLSVPLINDGLYKLLTTRPSIRYFYRQAFTTEPPAELIDYAYATTHQPGAKHAPLYFLSGLLFTPEAGTNVYGKVAQPVLVLYDKDPNIDFHELPDFLCRHANWHAQRIAPTRGMPQWERSSETAEAIERFWEGLG